MKYIKYTYVDVKTKKPVSQEPARRGPTHPKGVSSAFAIESTFSSGVPTFYGIAEDSFTPEKWMSEVSEESFYSTLKTELRERSSKRRKQVEQGGLEISEGLFVRTDIDSQNRLSSLIATVNNDPEITEIDFEALPGQWVTFTAQEAIEIGKAVARHVQHCFSWCRGIHSQIEALESLEEVHQIDQAIKQFGMEEVVEE